MPFKADRICRISSRLEMKLILFSVGLIFGEKGTELLYEFAFGFRQGLAEQFAVTEIYPDTIRMFRLEVIFERVYGIWNLNRIFVRIACFLHLFSYFIDRIAQGDTAKAFVIGLHPYINAGEIFSEIHQYHGPFSKSIDVWFRVQRKVKFLNFVWKQGRTSACSMTVIPYPQRGNLKLAVEEYLRQTDVVRIEARVYAANRGSMRVLETVGFRKCGIFRKACFKNGRLVDCHCYELLGRTDQPTCGGPR